MSIDAYHALKPDSSNAQAVLDGIANATPFTFTEAQRKELVQELLDDVREPAKRIGKQNVAHALNAIKMLGRQTPTALVIAKQDNLALLAGAISSESSDVSYNAMKIAANTLLLVLDTALDRWLATPGPPAALAVLRTRHEPEPMFLACRILFLCTVKAQPFVRELVDRDGLLDALVSAYEPALAAHLDGRQWAKDALIDLLKVSFNVLLNYTRLADAEADPAAPPKALGESCSPKLEPLLAPLLRTFATLPAGAPAPFVPPLTHVVHALIVMPVAPYAQTWLAPPPPSPSASPAHAADGTTPPTIRERVLKYLPGRRPASPKSSKPATPASSRPPSPAAAAAAAVPAADVVKKAYDLLDAATAWYMPDDPDDAGVRAKATKEEINLDDTLAPLIILLTRLAGGSDAAKVRLRAWLIPADLDRTKPLEERSDLLGRCLRVMKCVYFPRVKDTVGEFLFTLCDSDATTLCAQVGYGNVAGFLFNKGLMAPPPATTPPGAADLPAGELNPITGMRVDPNAPSALDGMTDEEKEREAERLFVLFDRLEKTGVGVQNPFRKAIQEGKIQFP
ncbi:hypothetical protein AURDEDRAFT_157421 [Auricularia subglabra TFB-10046 SS5]|nr:hypothetical protein AURDEDRAFT_157421 [Auricularia subglabra TFB-10046 SS5]